MREVPVLASITLQDVYGKRSLRAMADDLIEKTGGAGAAHVVRDLSFTPPPLMRRFLCGLAQAAALPVILTLNTMQWLGIFVTYLLLAGEGLGFLAQMAALLAVYVVINAVTALTAIALKWVVIGRTKPGRYPLWGVYYFRWWFVKRLEPLVHIKWLQGSPMIRRYLRLMGAQVGGDVIIADIDAGAIDLVSIGRGTTIGSKTKIANVEIIGNEMVIGEVHIGADVYVGSSCTIGHDVTIGHHAELADLTAIPEGTVIGEAEKWDGSPGVKVGMVDVAALPDFAEATPARRAAFDLCYAIALAAIPPVSLLPIFPAFYIFDQLDEQISEFLEVSYLWYLPVLAWPTALFMIFATVGLIALTRWLVLPKVRSGTYSMFSGFYMRKWVVALATEVTLETLTSLYATIYMRAWYRVMGATIGKGAEISTNLAGRYDLTEIGGKELHRRRGRVRRRGRAPRLDASRAGQDRGPRLRRQRRRRAAGRRHPRGRAHRHQVEAAGKRHDEPGRHLVRLAADQAADAPEGRHRRDLDLRAEHLEEALARRCSRRSTPPSRRCCSSPSPSCRSTTSSIRRCRPVTGPCWRRASSRPRSSSRCCRPSSSSR